MRPRVPAILIGMMGLMLPAHAEDVTIPMGGQQIVRVDGEIARIAVGDPAVADVKLVSARVERGA